MQKRIEVLDHGYVELVESWGSEEGIIEAARMSTQKGFLGWGTEEVPGDEKLLRYLWEHQHMTPFEMAGISIEVQAPIFVFREWHRHRTQCLGPDTLVHFEAPKGDHAGRRFVYKMRIEDVWKKWQPTTRSTRSNRQTNALFPRSRIQAMRLRCADEERREVVQTKIVDVIRGEPKPMVRVTLVSGKQLTATRAHRVLTSLGWTTLGEAIDSHASLACEGVARGLAQRWDTPAVDEVVEKWRQIPGWPSYEASSEGRVRRLGCEPKRVTVGANGYNTVSLRDDGVSAACTVHTLVLRAFVGPRPGGMEARHLNSNRADARLCNLEWASPKVNSADRIAADRHQRLVVSFAEIVSVEDVGELPTYDLSVEGPWHNFVADGVVVHNSFSEMSARYAPLPDVNYVPTLERMMLGGRKNKQAGKVAEAPDFDEDAASDAMGHFQIAYELSQEVYVEALKAGCPKELARIVLPVGRYSRMRASTDLRNWIGFLRLRNAPDAQWEIRQYAIAVEAMLAELFPRTIAFFQESR
jgi:flavin-dependent thymidylate synthase